MKRTCLQILMLTLVAGMTIPVNVQAFSSDAPISVPEKLIYEDLELMAITGCAQLSEIAGQSLEPVSDDLHNWRVMDSVTNQYNNDVYGYDNATYASSWMTVARGRFTEYEKDQAVLAYSALDASLGITVEIRDHDSSGNTVTIDSQTFSGTSGSNSGLDLAAGDLDEWVDEKGFGHDEIVMVSFKTDFSAWQMDIIDRDLTVIASAELPLAVDDRRYTQDIKTALGDFNNDGHLDVAVLTYSYKINEDGQAVIHIFHYDRSGDELVLEMEEAATIEGNSEKIDLAAGDFNGDSRDDLVVADSKLRLFYITDDWKANQRGTEKTLSVDTSTGYSVRVLPGLFRYEEASGFTFFRRQLAVAYGGRSVDLYVKTYEVDTDFGLTETNEWTFAVASGDTLYFDTAVGNFVGHGQSGEETSPLQQIALTTLTNVVETGGYYFYILNPDTGNENYSQLSPSTNIVGKPADPHLVALDIDGDSWVLGDPSRFNVYDLISLDYILQEPPKHVDYLPKDPTDPNGEWAVVDNLASTNFYVEFVDKEEESLKTKQTDKSSANFMATESLCLKESFSVGQAKMASMSLDAEESEKLEQSTANSLQTANQDYTERTISFSSKTSKDDQLKGSHQHIEIWSYPVIGYTGNAGQDLPDVVLNFSIPGPLTTFSTSGMSNSDWYQPDHQNKNILTYPNAAVLAGNFPQDVGAFTDMNGDEFYGTMNDLDYYEYGGSDMTVDISWKEQLEDTDESSWESKIKSTTEIKASAGGSLELPEAAIGVGGELSAEIDLSTSIEAAFSGTETKTNVNTASKGITLNIPHTDDNRSYLFKTAMYVSNTTGSLKVAHAVDPVGSTDGELWWKNQYGRLPDPALNLPNRFVTEGGGYVINSDDNRMRMRGFVIKDSEIDVNSEDYEILSGPPTSGDTVRLCANVYNLSLSQTVSNLDVLFEAALLDEATGFERRGRYTIGQTTLGSLPTYLDSEGPAMAEVCVEWDTTGWPTDDPYRFYVTLDPDDHITELHEWKNDQGEKEVTGNNEGYWPWTSSGVDLLVEELEDGVPAELPAVTKIVCNDTGLALAVDDEDGNRKFFDKGALFATPGKTYQLRAHIKADQSQGIYRYVIFSDGPVLPENIISIRRVSVAKGETYAWTEWTPTKEGGHRLYFHVLMPDPEQYGTPGDTLDVTVTNSGSSGGCFVNSLTTD